MPRNPDGTFSGPACVAWCLDRVESREVESDRPEPGERWLELFRKERYRLARIERRALEGKLVRWEDIEREWADRVRLVASGLEAFADRLSPLLVGRSREEIYRILRGEIRFLREAYSRVGRYTPEIADQMARERKNGNGASSRS